MNTSDRPSVTISVLNWNSWEETLGCLEAIGRIDYPNLKLIVVDNGSVDESVEKLMQWAAGEAGQEPITVVQTLISSSSRNSSIKFT